MENISDRIKEEIRIAKHIDEEIREYQSYDVDSAYLKITKRIAASCTKQLYRKYLFRAAAILLLPLMITSGVFSFLYIRQYSLNKQISFYSVSSAPGIITQLELPDHSKVWLNAGSTLRYPSRFTNKERTVYLEGEGYFDVHADEENPFYVKVSNGLKVKAYGTRFNVNSYANDSIFETVLEEGMLDLIFNDQSINLKTNKLASFNKKDKKLHLVNIYTEEKTSWKDGRLIFRNSTLEEVTKKLSRKYNIDFILHKKDSTEYRFRASFSDETITQILDYMKLAAPIEWSFVKPVQQMDSSYKRQQVDIYVK